MIPYERNRQQSNHNPAVKIIGVGGAGANILDRIALDGMEGAELLACNTDMRTLTSSVAPEKIQIGRNLTMGLGTGGDPEMGKRAAGEAELEIRDALRDRKIVFICVGLGGGTGSGAAPLVARLAREEGAFTVVFGTTPFNFEGKRRREQAETALNELSVLANALITFDNTRMGELILAKQGVHEAFSAADRMISESIRAVTRIVMRPGLVNIGLDDLMAALSTPKSRCLFGSGLARGENRAQQALKNALVSPLLDRGSLLHDTQTVLVHVCGGEDLTLYELELLMRGLSKHVPETAQILFGTSVDPAMSEALSVTLVSSLPEERLHAGLRKEEEGAPPSHADLDDLGDDVLGIVDDSVESPEPEPEPEPQSAGAGAKAGQGESKVQAAQPSLAKPLPPPLAKPSPPPPPPPALSRPEPEVVQEPEPDPAPEPQPESTLEPVSIPTPQPVAKDEPIPKPAIGPVEKKSKLKPKSKVRVRKMRPPRKMTEEPEAAEEKADVKELSVETPVKLPAVTADPATSGKARIKLPSKRPDSNPVDDVFETVKGTDLDDKIAADPIPPALGKEEPAQETPSPVAEITGVEHEGEVVTFETIKPSEGSAPIGVESLEEIQASARARRPQGELALDGGPKGKFEGEDPNLLEGEDLDIPPFLRKKK